MSTQNIKASIKKYFFIARNSYYMCCYSVAAFIFSFILGIVVASLRKGDVVNSNDKTFMSLLIILGFLNLIVFLGCAIRTISASSHLMEEISDYPEKKKFLVKVERMIKKIKFWCIGSCIVIVPIVFGVSMIFFIIRFRELKKFLGPAVSSKKEKD